MTTAAVNIPSLGAYNALANRITPLAKIISWEIPGSVLTTRDDMEKALTACGIPLTVMGKPLRVRARVERSINVVEVELRKLNQEGVLQAEREDDDAAVWNWMTHRIQNVATSAGDYRQVTTEIPRQFVYDKRAKTITATSDRLTKLEVQAREYQANGVVHDALGNRLPFDLFDAAREIGELRQQVVETQQMLDDLILKFGRVMLGKDVRSVMTHCVERAQGIAFRSQGGAYIIPRPAFHWVSQMQEYIEQHLGQGCSLKVVSLFDVVELVNGLEEMARLVGNGAIPADLMSVIDMAKTELASKDDVNAIFSAFEDHFIQAIKEKRDKLTKDKAKGRSPYEATTDNAIVDLAELTAKVEMFAQLLQFNAKDYLKEVKETERLIQEYAIESSRRAAEGHSGR